VQKYFDSFLPLLDDDSMIHFYPFSTMIIPLHLGACLFFACLVMNSKDEFSSWIPDSNPLKPQPPTRHAMESTLVYLVDTEDTVFVWAGSEAGSDAQSVAKRFAEQLARYEGSSNKLELIVQGSGALPAPLSSALEEMCCSLPQAAPAAVVPDRKDEAKAPSFPQGGASCAVATPRGERSAMPPMGLKLPLAAAPAVTPVKEEEKLPNQV